MLEVLSAGSTALSRPGSDPGMELNCWNKSSPLIKELERTVNFAERKCGDLMQELHFYKKYYEKWAQMGRVSKAYNKKKAIKYCRPVLDGGSFSENEFEKVNQYFYKKIKNKINEMSNEISHTNRKICSKKENPLTSAKVKPDEETDASSFLDNKTCMSETMMATRQGSNNESGEIRVTGKQSSKSVPAKNKMFRNHKRDSGPARKRHHILQRYKIRSKSLPQGVRRKFGFGGYFEVFEPETHFRENVKSSSKSRTSLKAESFKSNKSKNSLRKSRVGTGEPGKASAKSSRHRVAGSKSSLKRDVSRNADKSSKNVRQIIKMPQNATAKEKSTFEGVLPSGNVSETSKTEFGIGDNLRNLVAKPNALLPFLRHPIPFIPCSSTSRSFNLGLNVQQVLSLIKRKRHSVSLEAVVKKSMQAARTLAEPTVNALFISRTSHGHLTSTICPAREGSETGFSTTSRSRCSLLRRVQTMRAHALEEKPATMKKPARPEDVWVVEQPDPTSEVGAHRSRCTCFPSKHCADYRKILGQYSGCLTGGTAAASASSREHVAFDGAETHGRTELSKVHDDLLNLSRKCSSLEEQISQNCLDDREANAELDAMESEVAVRELEFKDILNFYNKLMTLKEKLKSLRTRNESAERPRPRRDPLRPTPSMTLAKVLRKMQRLQDKINLIDAP